MEKNRNQASAESGSAEPGPAELESGATTRIATQSEGSRDSAPEDAGCAQHPGASAQGNQEARQEGAGCWENLP